MSLVRMVRALSRQSRGFYQFFSASTSTLTKRNHCLGCRSLFSTGAFMGATLINQIIEDPREERAKTNLKAADPNTLTYSYLISQAVSLAADSALQVLSQTTLAVLDINEKYRQDLKTMLTMMEHHLTILGNDFEEERTWSLIAEVRSESETRKAVCKDLELFLASVRKLVEASAETAFRADCDYVNITALDRLYATLREIDESKEKTRQLEKEYAKLYSKIITESGKSHPDKKVRNVPPYHE